MDIAVIINNKEELKRIGYYIKYIYSRLPDVEYLCKHLPITIALSKTDWSWALYPKSASPTYRWCIFDGKPANKIMTCNEFFGGTNLSNLLLII